MEQGYGQAMNEFQQNMNPAFGPDSGYLPKLWAALMGQNMWKGAAIKKKVVNQELVKMAFLPALLRGGMAAARGVGAKLPGMIGRAAQGVGDWVGKWKGAPSLANKGKQMAQWGGQQSKHWGDVTSRNIGVAKQHYATLPNWAQQTYRGGRGVLKGAYNAYTSFPGQLAMDGIMYPMAMNAGAQQGAGQALASVADTYEDLNPMQRFGLAFDPSQLRSQMMQRVPQELAGYLR
jgi:hypothetical protein